MRAVEFFSGIGGWRYALAGRANIAAAFDINLHANEVYAFNHGQRPLAREIAGLSDAEILALAADTWLLSPPCQPFCRLGANKGLTDPRSKALTRLLCLLERHPPRRLVLENVVGFQRSEARARLLAILTAHKFHARERHLCPTDLGLPNRRPRYYLLASTDPLPDPPPLTVHSPALIANILDPEEDSSLYVADSVLAKHLPGMDVTGPEDARAACFISGYGQRYARSGSFLRTPQGIRRFSPAEIARLLGFPPEFTFPPNIPRLQQYHLLGNSLHVGAANFIINQLPPIAHSDDAADGDPALRFSSVQPAAGGAKRRPLLPDTTCQRAK